MKKTILAVLLAILAFGPIVMVSAQSHSVTITFTPSGMTSYNLYRGTTSGGEGSTPYMTGITASPTTDNNVVAGTTYFYKMTGVNSGGESGFSNETSCTIPNPPLPPSGVSCKGN